MSQWLLTTLLATTILGTVQISQADDFGAGNGADALVCPKRKDGPKVELLDLYEAKKRGWKIEPISKTEDTVQAAQRILDRLSAISTDPKVTADLKQWASEFFDPSQSSFETGTKLFGVPSVGQASIPEGCELVRLVNQSEPRFKEDHRYKINKKVWDKLDHTNQVATLIHEVIFGGKLRKTNSKLALSVDVRYLTGLLMSDRQEQLSKDDQLKIFQGVGIERFSHCDVWVSTGHGVFRPKGTTITRALVQKDTQEENQTIRVQNNTLALANGLIDFDSECKPLAFNVDLSKTQSGGHPMGTLIMSGVKLFAGNEKEERDSRAYVELGYVDGAAYLKKIQPPRYCIDKEGWITNDFEVHIPFANKASQIEIEYREPRSGEILMATGQLIMTSGQTLEFSPQGRLSRLSMMQFGNSDYNLNVSIGNEKAEVTSIDLGADALLTRLVTGDAPELDVGQQGKIPLGGPLENREGNAEHTPILFHSNGAVKSGYINALPGDARYLGGKETGPFSLKKRDGSAVEARDLDYVEFDEEGYLVKHVPAPKKK